MILEEQEERVPQKKNMAKVKAMKFVEQNKDRLNEMKEIAMLEFFILYKNTLLNELEYHKKCRIDGINVIFKAKLIEIDKYYIFSIDVEPFFEDDESSEYANEIKKVIYTPINFSKEEIKDSRNKKYNLLTFIQMKYSYKAYKVIDELVKTSFNNNMNLGLTTKYVFTEPDGKIDSNNPLRMVRYTINLTHNAEVRLSNSDQFYTATCNIDLMSKSKAYPLFHFLEGYTANDVKKLFYPHKTFIANFFNNVKHLLQNFLTTFITSYQINN